jgi:hypothetical protein
LFNPAVTTAGFVSVPKKDEKISEIEDGIEDGSAGAVTEVGLYTAGSTNASFPA